MEHPRFDEYSPAEAASIGSAFLRAFNERATALDNANATAQWTEVILDWFAATAPASEVVVDASPSKPLTLHTALNEIAPGARSCLGECMVDLAHHRFLAYDKGMYGDPEYWKLAYARSEAPEMLLALESEAGKQGNRRGNTHEVFVDASKLVPLAARIKVVVFGSNDTHERDRIRGLAAQMQVQDYTRARGASAEDVGPRPVWLWLDLPWSKWKESHGPNGWVGIAGNADVDTLKV